MQGNISKHHMISQIGVTFRNHMGKETCKVTFLNYIWNWCRAFRNHMGKETCKVTFLNTRITSGNWCRAFRNHMGKETCKVTFLNT